MSPAGGRPVHMLEEGEPMSQLCRGDRGGGLFMLELRVACVVVAGMILSPVRADAPRVLPAGQVPADTRLGPLKGEQGDFSFVPAKSAEEWRQRAERVRHILRVTLGLWPMPTPTPMNPVIHGKVDGGDYTVEKVHFE